MEDPRLVAALEEYLAEAEAGTPPERQAFLGQGKDRQELLRQIAQEEPPRPRRLNGAAPAELETVVLKALEKAPQDRYATAQALADDLRRYLANEPIRA